MSFCKVFKNCTNITNIYLALLRITQFTKRLHCVIIRNGQFYKFKGVNIKMNIHCKKYVTAIILASMLSCLCGVTASADQNNTDVTFSVNTPDTPDTPDSPDTPAFVSAKSPLTSAPAEQKRKRMGDVDQDDIITASDALAALRASIFRDVKPLNKQLSDVNGDGVCTSSDALDILRSSIGLSRKLLNKPENTNIEWLADKSGRIFGRLQSGEMAKGLVRVNDYICGFDEDGSLITGKKVIDGTEYTFTDNGVLVEGWQNEGGSIKYYVKGKPQNGWTTVFDQQFYFVDNAAVTGWQNLNGKKMYFNNYGLVSMGFTKIDGKTYYFDDNYDNKTGLLTLFGDLYYLFEDGGMAQGLQKINDKLYLFLDDGKAISGWQTVDGSIYYAAADHTLAVGKTNINGESYKFDDNGVMLTGWAAPDHSRYIVDGVNAEGFVDVDGVKYLFENGVFTKSKKVIDPDGNIYYIGDDGRFTVGEIKLDGDTYVFDSNGVMTTGWLSMVGHERYLKNGKVLTGLAEIDGNTYFFGDDGYLQTGIYTDSTGTYIKNEQGINQTGWVDFDGARYYCGTDGKAAKGLTSINGNLYYFDENFRMLRSTSVGLYKIDENGICTKIKIVDASTVKYKADEIISQVGATASALCDYVHNNVSYFFVNVPSVYADPYTADWASIAAYAVNRGYGACYHYSAFLHVLLQRAGITSRIVVGTGLYPSLHSYNQVLVDGEWLTYDAYYNHQARTTAYMQSLGYTYDNIIYYSYD